MTIPETKLAEWRKLAEAAEAPNYDVQSLGTFAREFIPALIDALQAALLTQAEAEAGYKRMRDLAQGAEQENTASRARADALAKENAELKEIAERVASEFECTIQQYHKIGPDMTCADGEFFCVSTILDREELIGELRFALKGAKDNGK